MTTEEILFVKGKNVLAEKQWGCSILVNSSIVDDPIRWRTLIHEMLHSVSVGTNEENYKRLRGWEEGVVEQLQRLLRPEILFRLNIAVPETTFTPAEAIWPYNSYIAAMERLRNYLKADLLRTPLADRLSYARLLDASSEYLRVFAAASGRLR